MDSAVSLNNFAQTGLTAGEWAAIISASGTLILAALALFGEKFRRRIDSPKLILKIASKEGSLTKPFYKVTEGERKIRYYHIEVSNSSRHFPFTNVAVRICEVEVWGPGDAWHSIWTGMVPLQWRHEEPLVHLSLTEKVFRQFESKTVGPKWHADLFHIIHWDDQDRSKLILNPYYKPNSLKREWDRGAGDPVIKLRLTVQAIGNEGDSKPEKICVEWDGGWNDGDKEMMRHISFSATQ